MKSRENLIGAWAILLGVVVAVILGVLQKSTLEAYQGWVYAFLAGLGVLIGFVSVRGNDSKDSMTFLLTTVSLVIVSALGQERLIVVQEFGISLVVILNALLTLLIPATIIVALKTLFSIASIK